nr:capsid protein [Mamastrovirus sp.]
MGNSLATKSCCTIAMMNILLSNTLKNVLLSPVSLWAKSGHAGLPASSLSIFGGADQSAIMVKAKRNVQVQVTTSGANRNRRGPSGTAARNSRRARLRRRRGAVTVSLSTPVLRNGARRRRVARSRRNVTNAVHRTLQRTGVLGPKPAISQSATATLGTIGANQGQDVELEGAFMLNPALTKETTGSNQFGPVQIAAATYNMWKLKRAHVRLTPLVGASAVSGTAVRVSLNLSGAPSSSSWSALGARKHVDTSPGRFIQFTITDREVPGPKEGWFLTSTKATPEMAIGGTIEIHTLGKTLSTYTNQAYNGDLFLVELHATWQFANYSPNPGMLNLVKGTAQETAGEVTINATPGEPITITTPATSEITRASGGRMVNPGRAAGTPTVGEIVWQIVDSTVDQIASNFPPPFNWLFKGGWWFMKRVTGIDATRDAAGEATFYVYQSISDAKNNSPCLATAAASNVKLPSSSWEYAQITPGNSGMTEDSTARVLDTGVGSPDNTIDNNGYLSYVGTFANLASTGTETSDDPQFGLTFLLYRTQKNANGGWNDRCVQPDTNLCVRFEKDSNSYPLVANGVIEFGAGLDDPYHTQLDMWIQDTSDVLNWTQDPVDFGETLIPVYKTSTASDNSAIAGYVCLGQTMARNDARYYVTTLVFKSKVQADITCEIGADVTPVVARFYRGKPTSADISSGSSKDMVLYMQASESTGETQTRTYRINQGHYYGLVYLGRSEDPCVTLGSVRIPLGLNPVVTGTTPTVLAFAKKKNQYGPQAAMMFSPIGMQSGVNLPFWYLMNQTPHWNNVTIPQAARNEQAVLEEAIQIISKHSNKDRLTEVEDQIMRLTLGASASLDDEVDARIPTPMPLGDSGGESENDLDSHTDTDDSGSDTETEQDNLYPPLECECKWGGHKHCPYPKRDELWSDPPEDICEVDGTQHGLVNVLIKGGLSPRKAKRAIALQNEDSPARVFQNLYEAHIECGLAKNTARGLSYCHALRALAGHDPYEVDSEGEQPALKKPKY